MESLFVLLRIVSVTGVLVLVPGYAFSLVLLPRRIGLDFAQRLALSGGLGLIVTVVIGTLLIESGLGFRLSTYPPALLLITCVFAVVIWMRSKKNVAQKSASVGQVLRESMPTKKQAALWVSALGIMILLTIILLPPSPKPLRFEQYTEFYVLDTTEEIPYYLTIPSDQIVTLKVGIISHEYAMATYQILVEAAGEELYSSHPISLAHGEQWESELTVRMPSIGTGQSLPLRLFLLKDGFTEPYRHLYVWVGENP
jgi:uncharacterized membrane protein